MSWHYLQGQEAASWEESCLDGAPSALLNLIPTAVRYSSQGSGTDTLIPLSSGMTSAPSTASLGGVVLMSSAEDSPARTSVRQGKGMASKAPSLDSGWRWQESSVKYDPATSSWRTRQCSLFGDLELFSGTWPRWGTMRDGECWELVMPVRLTSETAFGSWLPTPTVQDAANNGGPAQFRRNSLPLNAVVGGPLNPAWVEWLMGWPIGWTGLDPLETGRCQQWLRSHGGR